MDVSNSPAWNPRYDPGTASSQNPHLGTTQSFRPSYHVSRKPIPSSDASEISLISPPPLPPEADYSLPRGPSAAAAKHGQYAALEQLEIDEPKRPRRGFVRGVRRHHSGNTLFSWKWQLLAPVVSLASFAGLITVALLYDNKPLASWPLGVLSINGVVAALTTTMKGTLLVPIADTIGQGKWSWFSQDENRDSQNGRPLHELETIDDASRGPRGSLLWLFRHPLPTNVITLGAFLTLLAMALDVFSQQIIVVDSRLVVNSTGSAHVPWAMTVRRIDESAWYSALYTGVFTNVVDDLPADCPSGNCTWSRLVPSVGVCGACIDYTERMPSSWMRCSQQTNRCNYTGTDEFSPITLTNAPAPDSTIDFSFPRVTTQITVPVATMGSAPRKVYEELGMPQYSTGSFTPGSFEVLDIPVVEYDLIGSKAIFGKPTVNQCGFWFCIQAFNTSVRLGRQLQIHIEGPSSFGKVNDEPGGLITISTTQYFNETPGFNMAGLNFTLEGGPDLLLPPLLNALRSRVLMRLGYGGDLAYDMSSPVMKGWRRTTPENRDEWINRFAKSLSNVVRQQNRVPLEEDMFAGEAFSPETYIKVSWPWITYPAFVLASGLLLFTTNVITTLAANRGVWSNGSLLMLLADVDADVKQQALGAYKSLDSLMDSVGESRVRLRVDDTGVAFRSSG